MLDAFMGSGGFPKYQLGYIWGTNSIGKSTLALQIIASYQKQHGANTVIVYFDREESLTKQRLSSLGVDISRVVIINPEHIENVGESILKIVNLYQDVNLEVFAVWDTIAMTPAKETTDGYDKIGAQARALATLWTKLRLQDIKLTIFALNQHREKIGDTYSPKEPPGGNATKHKSFITLNGTSKKSEVWPDTYNIGRCTTLHTAKSKVISPYRKMVFEFTFVYGYDSILTAINFMWKKLKILEKTKGMWKFVGDDKKFYLKDLYKYMMSDLSVPKWKEAIEGIYTTLYPMDDPEYISQAKKRIYGYYFEKDKIWLERFTSINKDVVAEQTEEPTIDMTVLDALNE